MPDAEARGGRISSVAPGAAADAGLAPGDRVIAVDGTGVRDVIDWWWLTDEATFDVTIERDAECVTLPVERVPGEVLGVSFSDVVFDGVRECENACAFCFVRQLPTGLRPALYVRDDDFRLSFVAGNFITLTNVGAGDVERITEQHLSPLYVSIHAVDPLVRARLICPTAEDRSLEIVDRLVASGIELHVQVVLVPDVNDGSVLDETLEWLAARAGIASVGVVPMGYTAHQARWRESFTPDAAAALVAQLGSWQSRMRLEHGTGWVYAADEFYLRAGAGIPPATDYDGFPQHENGIGMVRAFLDEFTVPRTTTATGAVVTGELFAPVLRDALRGAGLDSVNVVAVANRLFGGNVAVAGLLGGADIAAAIAADGGVGPYFVPDVVVNSDGLLLDDVPEDALAERAGRDVRIIGSDARSLLTALTGPESQARE